MSLSDWANSGWLRPHKSSASEIHNLLEIADRCLKDYQEEGVSPDGRLGFAYNAALQCAIAALNASGYRTAGTSHHYYAIQSLAYTLKLDKHTINLFDTFRNKRNIADYDRVGTATKQEVGEMYNLAVYLRKQIESWLRENYPQLIS